MCSQQCVRYPAPIVRDFHIDRSLGKGAFGSVALVIHKVCGSKYALKTITFTQQFMKGKAIKEATLLQHIDHPCIVQLCDWWVTDRRLFILLEYMVGGDLAAVLRSVGSLSERCSKLTVYQLGLAVQYLHDRNIIHRDIKPANVLLKTDEEETLVKLGDFGVSKIEEFDKSLKTYVGTRSYMAPEVLFHPGSEYTNKVDIWSLGVILWECLTGRRPKAFQTASIECCPTVPDFAARMLAPDPGDRMSIRDMLAHAWFQDEYTQSKVSELLALTREGNQPDMPRELRKCGNEEFYFVSPVPRTGDNLPSYSRQRDLLAGGSDASEGEENARCESPGDDDGSSVFTTAGWEAERDAGSSDDASWSAGESDISATGSDDITNTSDSDITGSDADSLSSVTDSNENANGVYHVDH